jgi:hypothetical protein
MPGAWTVPGKWESVEVHCDRIGFGEIHIGIIATLDEETLLWQLRQKMQ